jgi:hypothetical protein
VPETGSVAPGFPANAPPPEGETASELPADVPVPQGASAITAPMVSADGITHGTYEIKGSAASVQTSYTASLLANGWSIAPGPGNQGSQALITATKGHRQLMVAIEGSGDSSQVVLLEMENPSP